MIVEHPELRFDDAVSSLGMPRPLYRRVLSLIKRGFCQRCWHFLKYAYLACIFLLLQQLLYLSLVAPTYDVTALLCSAYHTTLKHITAR